MLLQNRFAIGAVVTILCATGAWAAPDAARVTPADVIKAREVPPELRPTLPSAAQASAPTSQPTTPSSRAVPAPAPERFTTDSAHEGPAPAIRDLVVKHAHDNGVPVGLAEAVISIESRFNPRAQNRGAMGLMQIKTGTARNVGFSGAASGLLSADTNLTYGMKVLAEAYRASGGDVCRTLAYYQSGSRVRHFSRGQRSYCAKARAYMARA